MEVFQIFNWSLRSLPQIAVAVGAAVLLYLLPGLAALQIFWSAVSLEWTERLIFALGIGVALPPLLLEVSSLVHLPWQSWTIVAYLVLALLVLAAPLVRHWRKRFTFALSLSWQGLLLVWLIVLVLLVRLYTIRDLPVGMWGDSYQHTMMAQLIVDHGGLFSSWEPYAPLTTFTYHFGFHANVAFFHWLTGIPVTTSVLYVGQLLNAAAAALAYVLTSRLTASRAAGVWAVLLTGLLNPQPAFYVNWGRYTQLAGQVVLPVVLLAWIETFAREKLEWRLIAFAALVSACLALTHYIVAIFAALFLVAYLLMLLAQTPSWQTIKRIMVRSAAIGTVALFLTLPWILNTLTGDLSRNVSAATRSDRIASAAMFPPIIPDYIKGQILALAVVGFWIALAHRHWKVALLAIWSQLLILSSSPQVLGLPGAGIIDTFTAYIALYITLIPLAAYAFGIVQEALERWRPQFVRLAAALVIAVMSLLGANLNLGKIDSRYQLFTQADAQAIAWIREHTPVDARFLVNSFPAYGGTLVAGTDGGWWIPLLTGRQTNLPPLTYGSERGKTNDLAQRVNTLAAQLRERPLTDSTPVSVDVTTPVALRVLRDAHITYIYSGAHQSPGPETADQIDTAVLQTSPFFKKVYAEDGVQIFQFVDGN